MIKLTLRETKQSIGVYWPAYKKWEFLKASAHAHPLIIIGIETPSGIKSILSCTKETWDVTYLVHPYKIPKWKVMRFLKFQWLKFRVYFNLIP